MHTTRPLHLELKLLLIAAVLLLLGLQIVGFHGLRHDDAYITYRYGQNIAQGNWFVFNVGDRLLGTTAPGHAALAAAAYGITDKEHLPTFMSILGCIGWTAQVVALFFLLRPGLGTWPSFLVGLGVGVGAAQSGNWVALETNLAAALTLWAMVAAARSRWLAAGLVCAFAGLMRPDAYVAAVLLGVFCLLRHRTQVKRFLIAFVVASLPWLVFSTIYFGTPLPRSAGAKFQSAGVVEYLVNLLRTPSVTALPFVPAGPWSAAVWLVAGIGAAWIIRRDPRLWFLPAYAVLHLAAYLYLRPPIEHQWHLYPAVLVFVVLCLAGVAAVGQAAPRRLRTLVIAALLAAPLAAYAVRSDRLARNHEEYYWFGARDAEYRDLSDYLMQRAGPTDVVASYEVGTIGYYTEMPIHDWFGLVTRHPGELPATGSWMVSFWPDLAEADGKRPVRVFPHAGFAAYLYDARVSP